MTLGHPVLALWYIGGKPYTIRLYSNTGLLRRKPCIIGSFNRNSDIVHGRECERERVRERARGRERERQTETEREGAAVQCAAKATEPYRSLEVPHPKN